MGLWYGNVRRDNITIYPVNSDIIEQMIRTYGYNKIIGSLRRKLETEIRKELNKMNSYIEAHPGKDHSNLVKRVNKKLLKKIEEINNLY